MAAHPAPSAIPEPHGAADPVLRHSPLEDLQALVIGTLLVALAVTLFQHAGLLSGGTAGIAFLMHYLGGWSFGVAYFVLNLPFYWLSWRHMGRGFTLRTLVAVVLVSVMSEALPRHLAIARMDPWLAAVLGGILMGNGFLVLFRHHASLGGLGILALIAQSKRGLRAGHVQMAFDALIVAAAVFTVPLDRVALSIAAVVVLNLVIATNHRPGRYVAQ